MSENKKVINYGKISVKPDTKDLFDKRLEFAKDKESKKKISPDDFMRFLLSLATDEEIKRYQDSTLTWSEEKERLYKALCKKRKSYTTDDWDIEFRQGKLDAYIKENSRVQIF